MLNGSALHHSRHSPFHSVIVPLTQGCPCSAEEHTAREVSRGNELIAKQRRGEEATEIEPSAHDLNDVMEQFTKSFDVSISEEMEEFLRASDSGEISGGLRAPMIRLVQNTRFSFLVLVIVTTNVTLMAVEHHSMDPWLVTTMFVADIIFTVFYAFEMARPNPHALGGTHSYLGPYRSDRVTRD